MVTTLDTALLILTVVWGLIFVVYAGRPLLKKANAQDALWILSILSLFIVGGALLLYGFDGLTLFSTPIAGMLVPGLFAAGVLAAAYKGKYGAYYAVYTVLATAAYAVLVWVGGDSLPALLAVHVPSGLLIVFVPAIFAVRGRAALWLTSVGGVLISVAGVSLAAISLGSPILPADTVLLLAVPIIFLSTLFMTLGLMLTKQWLLSA